MRKTLAVLFIIVSQVIYSHPPPIPVNVNDGAGGVSVDGVIQIEVASGDLTNDGSGKVTIATGAGAGGDSITIDGVSVIDPDFASTGDIGFTNTSNTVTADINAGVILEADLNITNAPTDDFLLSYNAAGSNFTWVVSPSGGGSETNTLESVITGILDAEIFIGNGVDSGTFAALSGAVSLSNTGVVSVNTDVINDTHIDWGSGSNQVGASDVPFRLVNTPTVATVMEVFEVDLSTGLISGGNLSNNGDGTISVAAGEGFIRSTDSDSGVLYTAEWSANSSVSLTDTSVSYVYMQWVGTATDPTVAVSVTKPTDLNTNILLGSVYREGVEIHLTSSSRYSITNFKKKMLDRLQATRYFEHASGGTLSATGTRNIAMTAGEFWEGGNVITTIAQDTSGSSPDNNHTAEYFYADGVGGFTTHEATIDAVTFTGSGLDDATSGGTFVGSHTIRLIVTIDATGTPDTFKWSYKGADNVTVIETTGVAITGSAQTLVDGATVTFAATTGHTVNDRWEFDAELSSQINNTQYDDGSGTLATLSNNKLGVTWVYADVHGHIGLLFGKGEYTLSEAQDVDPPTVLPPEFETHARLVGRVIILKNATTFTSIQNNYGKQFQGSVATDHGDLSGLGDDDHTQYLMSTSLDSEAELEAQLTDVTDVFTNNDGALDDDDVTLADVQTATTSDFHNIGGTDDDIPESGDFGNGTDLDSTGAILPNAVALTTDTTGDYVANIVAGSDITSTGATTGEGISHTFSIDDSFLRNNGDVGTGVYDFGGATSLELPNSATPTTDVTGKLALDTSITDHQPLFQYFDGTKNMTLIAVDTSELPATDNQIVKYDAATDKFVLEADATGGGGGSVTKRVSIFDWHTIPDTSGSVYVEPLPNDATNDFYDHIVWVFEDTATKILIHGSFTVPQDYVGTANLVVIWTTQDITGANDVEWDFDYDAIGGNDTESFDSSSPAQQAVNSNDTGPSAVYERMEISIALTDGNFAAGDNVQFQLARDGTDAGDTITGDVYLFEAYFEYDN